MKAPDFLHVHVHFDARNDLWADIEELPGCFASGRDLSELHEALDEAVSLYLSEPGHEAHYELDIVEERDDPERPRYDADPELDLVVRRLWSQRSKYGGVLDDDVIRGYIALAERMRYSSSERKPREAV